MSKQITLKGLSKILKLSTSTISKSLNDSHEISEKTKKKVLEAAALYDYTPNIAAINLKSGKTNTIGVIIPSVQNYFLARVLYGIEDAITNTPYNVIVSTTKESWQREKKSIETLSNGLVDGFIVATSADNEIKESYSHLQLAIEKSKPIIMFDRVLEDFDCDKILVKDFEAVKSTANKMKKGGLSKIIMCTTIHDLSVGKLRIDGFKDVFKKGVVITANEDEIESKIFEYLKNNSCNGIIGIDEAASLAALRVCKKLKLKVPEDVAIVGYVSDLMAENLTPRLTTIKQHAYTIGQKAVEILLKKLLQKNTDIKSESISSTLIERDSTRF
jgi:LacI family transcriptional regulator